MLEKGPGAVSLGLGWESRHVAGGCRVRVCVCVLSRHVAGGCHACVCVCPWSRHVAVAVMRVCVRMCVCVHVSLSRHVAVAGVRVRVCPE